MNEYGPLNRRGQYIDKKGSMTPKWLDDRRKGVVEDGVLKANATTIQQCIKRMRHFSDKVDIETINKTLVENPSVVRTLDYGTNI